MNFGFKKKMLTNMNMQSNLKIMDILLFVLITNKVQDGNNDTTHFFDECNEMMMYEKILLHEISS